MTRTRRLLCGIALCAAPLAQAGPIQVSALPVGGSSILGGYSMVDFLDARTQPEPALSATSVDGDVVTFTGKNGVALPTSGPFGPLMRVGDRTNAGSGTNADPDERWWDGGDDGYYYADFGFNWIELVLPENTVAFSLTVDSNTSASAWMVATDAQGMAVDTQGSVYAAASITQPSDVPFSISLGNNKPARSFGFHVDNSPAAGSCNTLSKVLIDPTRAWGIGDFSIHVDDNACTPVPAPAGLPLAFGLLLLTGIGRRRRG